MMILTLVTNWLVIMMGMMVKEENTAGGTIIGADCFTLQCLRLVGWDIVLELNMYRTHTRVTFSLPALFYVDDIRFSSSIELRHPHLVLGNLQAHSS